ncbi:MAG: 30S ribosomal protein S17 [Acidobacteriaceae bacterium]|nr:30S ribosomal protein S17 [Acidobacteriaceae bacterium]
MSAPTHTAEKIGHKNEKVGEVISTKMAKTIVVEVTRRAAHPVYKRIVSKRKRFYAHDEQQTAQVGDVVRIIECRPLSRLKRWKLGTVIRRAVQVAVDHPALEADADTRVKKTVKKK